MLLAARARVDWDDPRTVDDAWARVVKALAGKFTMWRNTESLAYTFTQFALYTALP